MTRILDLSRPLADHFYEVGLRLEKEGETSEAVRAFERALHAQREHVPARLALAYHARRRGQLDEALEHCEAAIRIRPDAESYFALGYILIDQREYERALDALERCLTLDPDYHHARYHIAFVYYLRGDYDVAITEFHRSAHVEPEWETLFFLGECYRLLRRTDEANRAFQRALSLSRNWGQVELSRAQLAACDRLAEFVTQQELSIKDRAYCDCGVVYLGSRMDDGLGVPPYLFYHFHYPDLAATLRRLIAFTSAEGWRWDAVLPVDIISLPLALALARRFGVGTEPVSGGRTLVVQALGETIDGLQDAAERLDEAQTFCLLVCWAEEWRPDLVGVAAPLGGSIPWYRSDVLGALLGEEESRPLTESRDPDEIAELILDAIETSEHEPNLDAQVDYYRVHPRLRWRAPVTPGSAG